jgi:hypothetical protein
MWSCFAVWYVTEPPSDLAENPGSLSRGSCLISPHNWTKKGALSASFTLVNRIASGALSLGQSRADFWGVC